MDLYYVVITKNILEKNTHQFQVIVVTFRKENREREWEVKIKDFNCINKFLFS